MVLCYVVSYLLIFIFIIVVPASPPHYKKRSIITIIRRFFITFCTIFVYLQTYLYYFCTTDCITYCTTQYRFMPFYTNSRGYIYFRHFPSPDDECKFYIHERVDIKHWSRKSQRVLASHPSAGSINTILRRISDITDQQRLQHKIDGRPFTSDRLRDILQDAIFGPAIHDTPQPGRETLQTYTDMWLSRYVVGSSTHRSYKSKMKKLFEHFPGLDFRHITPLWRHSAQSRLAGIYSANNVSKMLSVLRTVLQSAIDDGVTTMSIPSRLVPAPVTVKSLVLSHDQIMSMYRHTYASPHLTNAVRLWTILYITAQRVSDLPDILSAVPAEIQGRKMIRFTQTKTTRMIALPFSPLMSEIWAGLPHIISDQKINKYIKEAALISGIHDYALITCHTARRSGATNLVLSGVPISIVMDITGHTTERECRKYVQYDDIQGAIRIGDQAGYHHLFM